MTKSLSTFITFIWFHPYVNSALASVVGRFLSLGGVEGQEGRLACFKGAGTRRTTAEATVISRAVLEGDGEGAAWTSGTWHRARHRASTS